MEFIMEEEKENNISFLYFTISKEESDISFIIQKTSHN
jgi:hypothetical protein